MLKRLLDLIFAILLLFVLSPILLILLLLVSANFGWPALFSQIRPGYKGKLFRIYKFRSMTNKKDPDGNLLPDEQRITPFGRFLRRTSLDELPELFNILIGQMSFVGPRPLLVQYLPRYNQRQARRHDVLPGLTGWAQVNGRNAISWQEKFELDVWYVENHNLLLDFKIILRTAWKVFHREGISQPGHATMEEFMGDPSLVEENSQTTEDQTSTY